MLYFPCDLEKQNTFTICWICFVFLFFRFIFKANSWKTIIMFYQKKPRFHMELDSKVQTHKDILKKKKCIRVHRWWDINQDRFRICLALGCYWANKQADSRIKYLQRKKHAYYRREIYFGFGKGSRKAPCFYRWRYLVSSSLPIPKSRASCTFSILEKSLIERTMQYIKDRTECFDDYFPCKVKNCKLKHVRNWLKLFIDYHNSELKMLKWTEPILHSGWI